MSIACGDVKCKLNELCIGVFQLSEFGLNIQNEDRFAMKTDFRVCVETLPVHASELSLGDSFLTCWAQYTARETSSSLRMELVFCLQWAIASPSSTSLSRSLKSS